MKKEEIANVAGDGAVSMPPTAKKVKKRKSKTFNVSPQLFDIFRRGKKKFEKWSKYLNMEDEGHRSLYQWAVKNREGIIVLQNSVIKFCAPPLGLSIKKIRIVFSFFVSPISSIPSAPFSKQNQLHNS